MNEVAENLARVNAEFDEAVKQSGRSVGEVTLMAVSKTWPVEHIQKAVDAGHAVFGENKLQEGEVKIPVMSPNLEWHYIGGLQRNKVRKTLPLFDVIHSVDSLKLANHINNVAADLELVPQIYLQVNIGDEPQKGGFSKETLREQLMQIIEMPQLSVQGLMCIPPAVSDPEDARPYFAQMCELRDALEQEFAIKLPGLSMGMSSDYKQAIAEGSTIVRVGSSIFGQRSYPV